jgi:hypothetical protein
MRNDCACEIAAGHARPGRQAAQNRESSVNIRVQPAGPGADDLAGLATFARVVGFFDRYLARP